MPGLATICVLFSHKANGEKAHKYRLCRHLPSYIGLGLKIVSRLRETLKHSLDIFQKHETELTSRINSYGEDAADSTGIMAVLSEMTEKIKTMMADSDEEILNQSIKAMDMGLKACHDFIDKHKQVPEELLFVIHDLEADYKKVYRDLTELKLNNY